MRFESLRNVCPARLRWSLVVVLAALVALAGCTADPDPVPGATRELGPEGGEALLPDGSGVRLPRGALRARSAVNVRRLTVPVQGVAPDDTRRLGDDEIVVAVDPAALSARYEVVLRVPAALVPEGTDPARLFVAGRYESRALDAAGQPAFLYAILGTTARREGEAWSLTARAPLPATGSTRLSAWLAHGPVTREVVPLPDGAARGGGSPVPPAECEVTFLAPRTASGAAYPDPPLSERCAADANEVRRRIKQALLDSVRYYTGTLQFPPPGSLRVTIAAYRVNTSGETNIAPEGFEPRPVGGADLMLGPGQIVFNLYFFLPPTASGPSLEDPGALEGTVAHEVFHLIQRAWTNPWTLVHPANLWVIESSVDAVVDELYDATENEKVCLSLTLDPLPLVPEGIARPTAGPFPEPRCDEMGRRRGPYPTAPQEAACFAPQYQRHPFFRWLGPRGLRAVFDEAAMAVRRGGPATVADLDGIIRARLRRGSPTFDRPYFDFVASYLYLKDFDRDDATPDVRGAALDETRATHQDLWSACGLGERFERPLPPEQRPDICVSRSASRAAFEEVFRELSMTDATARAGGVMELGRALRHLSGLRYDLSNRTGRRQRFMLEVEGMGPGAGELQARVYPRGSRDAQRPQAGACDAERLEERLSCVYDEEGPGTGLRDGTRVAVIANDGVTSASDGGYRGTWRALPTRLRKAVLGSGDGQSGPPGTALPQPFVVEPLDLSGMPMGGVRVTWEVLEGGGSVSVREGRSAAGTGRAETVLTLGPRPGVNRVRARAYNLPDPSHPLYRELEGSPVEFVTGDVPRIRMASRDHGNGQSGVPGMRLTLPFAVEVVDPMDRPVGDVRVTWELAEGGGSVSPRENRTAPVTGRAEAVLTLGPAVGLHRVLARAWDPRDMELPGSPVVFTTAGLFSCDFVAGPTHQCSEFEVPTMGVEEQRRACTGAAGRTWAAGPCPRAGAVGGCRIMLPMGMGWTTAWYYGAPFTPDLVRATCALIGATFVSP